MKWIRKGEVSSVNTESMTVRVAFDGLDTSVSDELSIVTLPGQPSMRYLPQVGDTVICIYTESTGYCIGLLQDEPPAEDIGVWGLIFDESNKIVFKDGQLSIYATELLIDGSVNMTANVQINGNLNVTGTISGSWSGRGDT